MTRTLLAFVTLVLLVSQARAQIYLPESGQHTWNSAANWRDPNSVPNGIGATATFLNPSTSPGALTVSLDTAVTVAQLSLTNNTTHERNLIAGSSGSLIFQQTGSDSATLSMSGTGNNAFTISSAVTLNSHLNITVDNLASVSGLSLTGSISGSNGLTKLGGGLLVLSGTNSYAGSTILNAGTTHINGNQSAATGSIMVNANARLGGTGGIAEVTVASGGTLFGGTGGSTGTLSAAGITLEANAVLLSTIGVGSASRVDAGDVTLNLTTGTIVKIVGAPGLTRGQLSQWTLATLNDPDSLLLDGNTVQNGEVIGEYTQGSGSSGALTLDLSQLGVTLQTGDLFQVYRSDASLKMRFVPVPEPNGLLILLAALLSLGGLQRCWQSFLGAN